MQNKIRVFISYSRENKEFVERMVNYIKDECEVNVIWDKDLTAGTGFHEQIKDSIASSHIFMPLITNESSNRGWVHQEIGYAMGLNIPVLPLTTENNDPSGMLSMIHAVKIEQNIETLSNFLNKKTFQSVLKNSLVSPIFQCAHLPEERTSMITQFADRISNIEEYGMVRQKGGLSSFHIPDVSIIKQEWNDRYYPEQKSEYHKRLQRNERLSLEKHAQKAGYKIIINPNYAIRNRDKLSAVSRLKILISFLQNTINVPAVVGIVNKETPVESLTIVGDWFLAESVSFKTGDGFTNTFFTRNTSEIASRTEDFECELHELLDENNWTAENSREKAIEELIKIMNSIKV